MRRYRFLFILLALDIALVVAHIFLRQKLGFFNLDKEGSLKAVYSGFQLLVTGGVASLIAFLLARAGERASLRWLWIIIAAGFFYLGLDEMMVIHERIGFVFNRWSGLTGYWGESFNWLLYFSPLIAGALVVYFFLFRVVWKEDWRVAIGILLGTFFFAISILFETVGGIKLGTDSYQTLVIFEESGQLIGETLFLSAFMYLLQKKFNQLYSIRI